jgi:hypothetical protein
VFSNRWSQSRLNVVVSFSQLTYLLQNSLSGNSKTLVRRVVATLHSGFKQTFFPDDSECVADGCAFERVAHVAQIRYQGQLIGTVDWEQC